MAKKQKNEMTKKSGAKESRSGYKDVKKDLHDTWNIEPLLDGKDFDKWMKYITSKVDIFKGYRKQLDPKISPSKFLEILKAQEDISLSLARLEIYYELKFYTNTKDPESLAKLSKIKQMDADVGNELLFFDLWFIALDDKDAKRIIDSQELKPYSYHLKTLRQSKPYTKSEEIEKILQLKDITGSDAYSELYQVITGSYSFEWEGKKIEKEAIMSKVHDDDPKVRENAYKTILAKYADDSTILSEIYKNIVLDEYNEGVKIRGYKSPITMRNIANDVSDKSVEVLLDVVRKNAKIFIDYFKLKHDLNTAAGEKYPNSRYHIYAPLAVKKGKKYPYEESKKYVLDTYNRFDARFYDKASKIFSDAHVHSHPMQNKREGAFCYPVMDNMSPYLMLNHTDTLRDVFTMAHELGHGIHDMFAAQKQADLEKHAALTICETASVFGEMLLAERLLKESKDKDERRYILVQQLDNQFATIIRQAYFVIFETYAHDQLQKGASKDILDKYCYDLMKEQFGDMQIPDVFCHEWNYVPHIYEKPFYCYAYAWGNLFVLALYDMYKNEGKGFVDKYIELLSAGGSDSPANLMKKLGVDPESEEFWQRGFNIIKEEVEELKKLSQ